jgi:hypothetical protein
VAAALLAAALSAPGAAPALAGPRQEPRVNPGALTIKQFLDRVDAYLKLREKVRSEMPKLKETSDPKEITSRERALGEAIRGARPGATQGEIFSVDVAPILRQIIAKNLNQRSPAERRAAIASLPSKVILKVNDFYPTTVPLATVPPTLLAELPRLPDTLEYRLAAGRLILRDVNANLVVDVLPNAVPVGGSNPDA